MKDPFLEDCGGWTPAPDVLTRNSNYGFEGAYLWGRIRRLCQIGKGSYTISHEELGKRIGMSRRTVIKYLDRLIEDGYVDDLTPGVRNKAHTYSVKKGEAKILAGVQISHTESDMVQDNNEVIEPEGIDVGMRNLHSDDAEIAHLDDGGMQNLPNRYAKNAHPGMQNLHLKRDSLETDLRDSLTPKGVVGKPTAPVKDKLPGPLTKVKEAFEELTNLKTPTAKGESKAWWGWYGQILEAGGKDADRAIKIIRTVIKHMDASGLAINKPKSIVDSCRAVAAGRSLGKNGSYANGIHPANKSSPLSAGQREALKQQQAQDAKEIHIPGS